jgi:hypothetical protein
MDDFAITTIKRGMMGRWWSMVDAVISRFEGEGDQQNTAFRCDIDAEHSRWT